MGLEIQKVKGFLPWHGILSTVLLVLNRPIAHGKIKEVCVDSSGSFLCRNFGAVLGHTAVDNVNTTHVHVVCLDFCRFRYVNFISLLVRPPYLLSTEGAQLFFLPLRNIYLVVTSAYARRITSFKAFVIRKFLYCLPISCA